MKRNVPRINYKSLHTTGAVEYLTQDTPTTRFTMPTEEQIKSLKIDIRVIVDQINDVIDENPLESSTSFDTDRTIEKLEDLRNQLRRKSLQIGNSDLPIDTTLDLIKGYIVSSRDRKLKSRLRQEKEKQEQLRLDEQSVAFSIINIARQIQELHDVFNSDPSAAKLEQLLEWKTNQHLHLKKFDKIALEYKELLKIPVIDEERQNDIQSISKHFDKLSMLKKNYSKMLDDAVIEREPDKLNNFNKQLLNIKLQPFAGYDSNIDFYTFKSNFEKVHLQSTPSCLLPDLLKNNFLVDPALTLVKSLDDIDQIWRQLEDAYGDPKIMLIKKMRRLSKLDAIKTTSSEKLSFSLGKIINVIQEVMRLAKEHKVEEHLYYGEGIITIYNLLGKNRTKKFLTSIVDDQLSPKDTWIRLVTFLEREKKVHQQQSLLDATKDASSPKDDYRKPTSPNVSKRQPQAHNSSLQPPSVACQICDADDGSSDHVPTSGPNGSKILQYFTCKKFVLTTPAQRLKMLRDRNYCMQCLFPGADASTGKHAEGRCQRDFVCPNPSHRKYPVKKHFLVCEEHKTENDQLLTKYAQRFIRSPSLPDFSHNLSLALEESSAHKITNNHCDNRGVYLLQRIQVDGKELLIFFDNGCSDFVISKSAVDLLGARCSKQSSGPIILGGVGNCTTKSTFGTYHVKLPLHDGRQISLSGVCLETITSTMPTYPLDEVFLDIQQSYKKSGGQHPLPKLPPSIGGDVHMMIGIKYLRYHPKSIHQLSSGLTIYESFFKDSSGRRGVVGGPHRIFTNVNQHHHSTVHHILREHQTDVPLLGYKQDSISSSSYLSSSMKLFEEVESTGSEINYRCPQCRSCKACKHESTNDIISIKEEVEQSLINSSVKIDLDKSIATASLPFTCDPSTRLANNKDKAMKVYLQQLKKLNHPSNVNDKEDILESEAKLQKLGYVDFVRNLPPDVQSRLRESKVHYFIPWRAVWKGNSLSTPCRIVFDASQATSTGYSLNDILAKGRNNLNKLQEVLLRWTVQPVAIHTDVKKMYNTTKLEEKDWCYQRYLWHHDLDINKEPEEKVIKTLIYGVRSSGNQSEFALRKVAEMSKDEYPDANDVIQHDIYVDDCLTGAPNREAAHQLADEVELTLNRGGFELKGVAFSGEDPPSQLTDDGEMIHIAGLKWFVKSDQISLNIGEMNFAKKVRGKKPAQSSNIIPEKLSRRHCASKVAEVFDLTGKLTPLIASMKIDLQTLVHLKLDWDDRIPDNLRPIWEANFDTIQEIGDIRFRRAVVPPDAVNLQINTLDFGDASKLMTCIAIYARFLRKDSTYSCQLIFARSRTVPKDMSMPRAELYAALINTHSSEIVRRSLMKWHESSIKFTDSQIVLHWLDNDEKPLKTWVRNRVNEVNRFTSKDQWFYVNTKDMIADLGTRKGATIQDVYDDSKWINGYDWMKLKQSDFPIMSAKELRLSQAEMAEIHKEMQYQVHHIQIKLPDEVQERYQFSNYLIDPNYRDFSSVIRILAFVYRFINNTRMKQRVLSSNPTKEEISLAETYFFKKATNEIRHFLPPKKYEPISIAKGDVLYFNGRILPSNQVTIVGRFTDAMLDLTSTSFCVPLVDRHSPIAFSIISDVHWNHRVSKHSGVETTLREVTKKVYIIDGRSTVKLINRSCQRCKYLKKQSIEASMGPIPQSRITVAPAFYFTQLDLSGPYKSFSPHNKRATVKIWLVVYCCCVTSATCINIMDDYSTPSFLQSFTRFASRYGFPKKIFCDEGGQLMKGSKDMRLSFSDISGKLHRGRGIEMETCPVGAHNMHGKVERKIREVNSSLEKNLQNERLSILQWETICSMIANAINDLPIAIGNLTDVENFDLVTPNRLLLGRNNDRSPTGDFITSSSPTKIITQNFNIYDSWFESWLMNHVPKLLFQEKWFRHDRNLEVGDVVLFKKIDSSLSKTYTYGMISKVEPGNDGKVRRVIVKYRNDGEKSFRETSRSVRDLVLIHSVNDCELMKDMYEMSKSVDSDFD